jgi:hypothetical protein
LTKKKKAFTVANKLQKLVTFLLFCDTKKNVASFKLYNQKKIGVCLQMSFLCDCIEAIKEKMCHPQEDFIFIIKASRRFDPKSRKYAYGHMAKTPKKYILYYFKSEKTGLFLQSSIY